MSKRQFQPVQLTIHKDALKKADLLMQGKRFSILVISQSEDMERTIPDLLEKGQIAILMETGDIVKFVEFWDSARYYEDGITNNINLAQLNELLLKDFADQYDRLINF